MPDSNSFTRSQPQVNVRYENQALKGRHTNVMSPLRGWS